MKSTMDALQVIKEYRLPLVIGGISILLILSALLLLISSFPKQEPIQFSSTQASGSASLASIVVDIAGGVNNPGVYAVEPGSRVEDVIIKAGGLSSKADMSQIAKTVNRAATVSDGAKLYIPIICNSTTSHNGDCAVSNSNTSHNLSNQEIIGESIDAVVSINGSSIDELESLPGVGPVTAKKIIDNRPYQDLSELISKKAVGQALFEKIKGQLSL